ncbi:MAG: Na+/H+ antiporter NhaA [Hyphomicrobiaceae bacterium]|nr:Na+/H+ antiporter NhaA [Hyphomicrobiaceae bacterium]
MTTSGTRGAPLSSDAAAGILLIAAAVLALAFSNTSLYVIYTGLLNTKVSLVIGAFSIDKPLLLWINDGLMAVFFLLVGLELKREFIEGELSDRRRAALPLVAALGGLAMPAAIYLLVNYDDADALRGWAIPAATDIAFALGILALLGSRVPVALKVFLLAVAIIDDLAAIVIIAVFYTDAISATSLAIAGAGTAALLAMNRLGVRRIAPFVLVGIVVWAFLLKSGVHATLAGVVTALFVPHSKRQVADRETVLLAAEHNLKPWVLFFIMPVFAFANAGVSFADISATDVFGPITIGIALGLFLGKPIGIMGAVWLAVRAGLAKLPEGITWQHIFGVALLAGVGFTMSLFIGSLAFAGAQDGASVRIGVLTGSVLSGLCGYLVLRRALNHTASNRHVVQQVQQPA